MLIFAKRLKNERIVIGLSQKSMAEKLGISRTTYSHYEADSLNYRQPSFETLVEIENIKCDHRLFIRT